MVDSSIKSEDITGWIDRNQTRHGGTWEGLAYSMAFRMGAVRSQAASVNAAIDARLSEIGPDAFNADWTRAPAGAVHYFKNSQFGNLAVDINGGGSYVLTVGYPGPSELLAGEGLKITSIDIMVQRNPKYIGWTRFESSEVNL